MFDFFSVFILNIIKHVLSEAHSQNDFTKAFNRGFIENFTVTKKEI